MDNKISNITCITKRMKHHARMSGYDRLSEFLDATNVATRENLTLVQRVLARSCRSIINGSGSKWYHRDNWITELIVARQWLLKKNNIFHFLYGENSYRYLGNLKSIKNHNRIFCTYHTPPSRFQKLVQNRTHMQHLDAAIVVSTVQMEFFSDLLGTNRVFFVPHGIDTDYFRPRDLQQPRKFKDDDDKKETVRCIFVGSHLRDLKTLRQTAEILLKRKSRVLFLIVTSPKNSQYFENLENVEFYSSVSDKELLELYQSSDLLVMPLLDCTANNALLEGMACGLPIIATDLKSVQDYVDRLCSVLIPPHDAGAFADAIMDLAEDDNKCDQMGQASRSKAMEFGWINIAQQIKNIYKKFD